MVRVLPDQTGLTKTFDYVVPTAWADRVEVGSRVRIQLGPRRVAAWIVAVDVEPPAGVELRAVTKLSGRGPSAEVIELAEWAAWRWAARSPVPFLRTASPERIVDRLPDPPPLAVAPTVTDPVVTEAFARSPSVLRLPPTADLVPVATAAAALGPALVLCPSRSMAALLAARLRRAGLPVALHPEEWARAAAGGCTVIGTRAAAWAPVPGLAAVVVVDEHDEAHQEESSPTWHVRDVALERARRAGAAYVATSPTPTLEALAALTLVRADRATERDGWPAAVIVDRREDDAARNALFSPALVSVIRSDQRLVCVLNTKGRAALLACRSCHELARCEHCQGAMARPGDESLICKRCGVTRPMICAACGGLDVATVRLGVSRVVEDLVALAGETVIEVTAETPVRAIDSARLFVGTEAVLHQVPSADVVAFLDFDQELLAPRVRAAEQALTLVVRAARLVGGRRSGGRLVLQTRTPEHEVCRAALLGDPSRVSEAEDERRLLLGMSPHRAVAEIGDQAGAAYVEALRAVPGLEILGPNENRWQVRAESHEVLCDALAATPRPPGRLRLSIDPLRL